MSVGEAEVAQWRAAIGRTVSRRQRLDTEALRRFALAIGADPDVERVPPALALWAWFLEAAPDEALGPDGHPRRGDFLPAVTLKRRMFASGDVRLEAPLLLDRDATMESRIADVRHKAGKSGDLVFVEVDRIVTQDEMVRVVERQTLVYREPAQAGPLPLPIADAGAVPPVGATWRPNTVNLFRFSAVTFNGHRIHYDAPYATEVEGYPALVVQGPFTVAKLASLAAKDGDLAGLSFRANAPLFVDQPVRLARMAPGEFAALRCDGAAAVLLTARYR